MGGDEYLSATLCVSPELFRQIPQQRGLQLVLGLLDAEHEMRMWILEQDQIGQHLDLAVRDVARRERNLDRPVLESQQHSALLGGLGL